MKYYSRIIIYCLLLCTLSLSSFAQETDESINPIWAEAGVGIGRTFPPILTDASGKTYGEGDYWNSYNFLLMRSLPKSLFSVGGFFSPHNVNHIITVDGRDYKSVSYRWMIGPSVAVKKNINQSSVVYMVAGAGVKWDIQNKNLKSFPYVHYCQNAFSPVATLSATYAGRLNKRNLSGIGFKGTVYSFGNAKGIDVQDPLIDSWEISLVFYLTKSKHAK